MSHIKTHFPPIYRLLIPRQRTT